MGRLIFIVLLVSLSSAVQAENKLASFWSSLWWTPEQQGQRLYERGDFKQAAAHFQNPMQVGNARYRAGDFEDAVTAYAHVSSAEGAFNQGTALILLGKYDLAVAAFDRALEIKPDWKPATENRGIALHRMRKIEDQELQEATELGADDIEFNSEKAKNAEQVKVVNEQNTGLSEQQLRALWLKRSQTSPAVFLRARFASQLATKPSVEQQ